MADEAVDTFHASLVAGDTWRVDISNGDYPATGWTLQVLFNGPSRKVFTATADGSDYELTVSAAESAKITAGTYDVSLIFTETATSERITEGIGYRVEVEPDPTAKIDISKAQQTLEAMESALLKLANGTNQSVSFNGQSFTKKNLKELQDAIGVQRGIVNSERKRIDAISGRKPTGIFTRFSPNAAICE